MTTAQEAFEAWWKIYGAQPPSPDDPEESAQEAWLTACKWQGEMCAQVAEKLGKSYYRTAQFKRHGYVQAVANAIRATLSGKKER